MLQAWFWHWFWGLYFCSWGVSSSVINGFPGHKAECCRFQARIFVAGSGVVTLLYELHGSCQVDINGIIYWGLWQKRCNWCVCDQGLEHSELEGSAQPLSSNSPAFPFISPTLMFTSFTHSCTQCLQHEIWIMWLNPDSWVEERAVLVLLFFF